MAQWPIQLILLKWHLCVKYADLSNTYNKKSSKRYSLVNNKNKRGTTAIHFDVIVTFLQCPILFNGKQTLTSTLYNIFVILYSLNFVVYVMSPKA